MLGPASDQERLAITARVRGSEGQELVCKALALTARKNSGVPTSQPCTMSGVPARLSFRSHMIWFSQQRFAVACSPSIVHVELSGALLAATICVRTAGGGRPLLHSLRTNPCLAERLHHHHAAVLPHRRHDPRMEAPSLR